MSSRRFLGQMTSESTPRRMQFTMWFFLLTALIAVTASIVEISENSRFRQTLKANVLERLAVIRANLEGSLNSELRLSTGLITTIHLHKGIDPTTFSRACALIFKEAKYVRNMALARGTVIEHVYPLQGNERAIGLDYSKNEAQWPAAKRAIESRSLVVAGPVNLVQGGVGIIGRMPVYLANGNEGTAVDVFYGLLAVVIDIPKLMEGAGIQENDPNFSIAIRGKDGLGEKGDVFLGDPSLFTRESVSMEVRFSDNTWILAATPRLGWEMPSPRIASFRIAFSMAWLVAMFLLALQYREMNLRQEADTKRAKSEERYRALVETTGTGFVIINSQGRVLDANKEYVRLTGYGEQDEILGRSVLEWTSPYDKEKSTEAVARCLSEKGIRNLEINYIWPNGQVIPIEINSSVQGEGESVQIVSLCRDITERKKLEEARRETETRFDAFMDNLPVQVLIKDHELRPIYFNRAFLERLPGNQWLGKTPEECFPPEVSAPMRAADESALVGNDVTYEETWTSLDGASRDYITRKFRIDRPELPPLLGVFSYDITQRKRAEEELQASERRFSQLIQNSYDTIVILDADGIQRYVSASAERVHGYTPDELVDIPVIERMIHPDDQERLEAAFRQIIETGTGGAQYRHRCKTGGWVHLEARGTNQLDNPDIRGVLVNVTDITERVKAQDEAARLREDMAQAQKLESIGKLAGGVAHDFNNMLGVIFGHVELAQMAVGAEHRVNSHLKEIENAASRSAAITRQLLAFARKQSISPKVVNLNYAVEPMLNMIRRLIGEDIQLSWLPGGDLWNVKIDPSQIDQILANLATNARDAIVGVGKVDVKTGNVEIDTKYCAAHPGFLPGQYVVLTMADSGLGIEPEKLPFIFDPFFTTKDVGKGTGLGLATIYGIVKQNSGFIDVASAPGQGSVFSIYLPKTEEAAHGEEATIANAKRGHETILVVEDEVASLDLLRYYLTSLGYKVLTADNPVDGISLAKSNEEIDLLVTDIVMPGMDGKQLADELRLVHKGLRYIFMSGYTSDVLLDKGVIPEDVNFIQKPYSLKDMGVKVRWVLDS